MALVGVDEAKPRPYNIPVPRQLLLLVAANMQIAFVSPVVGQTYPRQKSMALLSRPLAEAVGGLTRVRSSAVVVMVVELLVPERTSRSRTIGGTRRYRKAKEDRTSAGGAILIRNTPLDS